MKLSLIQNIAESYFWMYFTYNSGATYSPRAAFLFTRSVFTISFNDMTCPCPHVLPSFCGATMVHKWHYASSFTLAGSFRFGRLWGFIPFMIVFSDPSRLSKTYRRSKWQVKLINNTCFEKNNAHVALSSDKICFGLNDRSFSNMMQTIAEQGKLSFSSWGMQHWNSSKYHFQVLISPKIDFNGKFCFKVVQFLEFSTQSYAILNNNRVK